MGEMTSSSFLEKKIDYENYEFLKNEILSYRGVIYAKKIKNKILDDYQLDLDYNEERSLSSRLGKIMQGLCEEGHLAYFSSSSSGNIKYIRR